MRCVIDSPAVSCQCGAAARATHVGTQIFKIERFVDTKGQWSQELPALQTKELFSLSLAMVLIATRTPPEIIAKYKDMDKEEIMIMINDAQEDDRHGDLKAGASDARGPARPLASRRAALVAAARCALLGARRHTRI